MISSKAPLRSNLPSFTLDSAPTFGRPTLFFALALSLGVLGVYLFTLSNNYSPDSMAFALQATSGRLTDPLFFQAEHLLWPFLGWLWYQLWVFFGYQGGALAPMQVLNAAGGAAGVGFFFLSLRLLLGDSQRAILLSILTAFFLAGTYGYWYHSVEAEDQIISNALVLFAFMLFVLKTRETKYLDYSFSILKPSRVRRVATRLAESRAFLASIVGLAILMHATAVLFLPALLIGLWLRKRDLRTVAVVLVGVVALVGVALLVGGALTHGFRLPGDYVSWLLSAPNVGVWGKPSPRSLWIGAQTLANAVVFLQGGPGFKALLSGVIEWRNVLSVSLFLVFWIVVALVASYFIRHRRGLGRRTAVLVACLVWFALFGLFNLYWAPEDIQFWTELAPPLLVAMSIAHLDLVAAMKSREELLNCVLIFGLSSIFVINLVTAIIPRASLAADAGLYKALCVGQAASPNDLVITPGWDWASSYVPYFSGRQVLSIADTYLLTAGGDRGKLLRIVDERMAETAKNGGKVFVVRLYSLSPNDSSWFKQTTGLTADDLPFKRQRALDCGGEELWEVVRQ